MVFGGERTNLGTISQTDYGYTGQRDNSYIKLMDYRFRWYSPELGRFILPDNIIPNPTNPQSLNRYSYVVNRPINLNDPTGHDPWSCDNKASGCDSIFSNRSKCDAKCRQYLIYRRHTQLQSAVGKGPDKITDLEGLARLTDYAAGLAGNCTHCFVEDLGATLTGHDGQDGRPVAYRELEAQANFVGFSDYYNSIVKNHAELMQSGYADIFTDPAYKTDKVGGNQAHHYWFYVQVGYQNGFYSGVAGSALHETVMTNDARGRSYGDYALGVEGSLLGKALGIGIIKPSEVGDYILQTLSPGSSTSSYWQYPVMPIFP